MKICFLFLHILDFLKIGEFVQIFSMASHPSNPSHFLASTFHHHQNQSQNGGRFEERGEEEEKKGVEEEEEEDDISFSSNLSEIFLVFDILILNSTSLLHQSFLQRRQAFVNHLGFENEIQFLSHQASKSSPFLPSNFLRLKKFYDLSNISKVFGNMTSGSKVNFTISSQSNNQQNQQRSMIPLDSHVMVWADRDDSSLSTCHFTDGIIFQPNREYVVGTDHEFFKWKFLTHITCDVNVQSICNDSSSSNHNKNQSPIVKLFSLPSHATIEKLCEISFIAGVPLPDLRKIIVDQLHFQTPIVELNYKPEYGIWKYDRIREDKQVPNALQTVLHAVVQHAEKIDQKSLESHLTQK